MSLQLAVKCNENVVRSCKFAGHTQCLEGTGPTRASAVSARKIRPTIQKCKKLGLSVPQYKPQPNNGCSTNDSFNTGLVKTFGTSSVSNCTLDNIGEIESECFRMSIFPDKCSKKEIARIKKLAKEFSIKEEDIDAIKIDNLEKCKKYGLSSENCKHASIFMFEHKCKEMGIAPKDCSASSVSEMKTKCETTGVSDCTLNQLNSMAENCKKLGIDPCNVSQINDVLDRCKLFDLPAESCSLSQVIDKCKENNIDPCLAPAIRSAIKNRPEEQPSSEEPSSPEEKTMISNETTISEEEEEEETVSVEETTTPSNTNTNTNTDTDNITSTQKYILYGTLISATGLLLVLLFSGRKK